MQRRVNKQLLPFSYSSRSPSTRTLTGDLTATNLLQSLPLKSFQMEPGPGRAPWPGAEAGTDWEEAGSWISCEEGNRVEE